MKRKIASIMAGLLSVVMLLTISGCGIEAENPILDADIEFIQFEEPEEGAPIATIDTTYGDITVVLYPEEAPNAVENFLTLAQQGYYDGTCVFSLMSAPDGAFLAGTEDKKGKTATSIFDGKDFNYELSPSLWSYAGALGSISTKDKKASSRFFIVSDGEVPQDMLDKMVEANYPQKVIDKFAEVGGAPLYSRLYTIYGQVIEGMDVVNKIVASDKNENNVPVDDIIINTITVGEYHREEAVASE